MLTVGSNQAVVEELLGNGLLSCPGCGGRLGGWGHASRRPVFTAGRVPVAVRPRILNEKYGAGNWPADGGSGFSKIVKWVTRGGRLS